MVLGVTGTMMTCTFDGVALVTGGAQGIGEAIGRGLAAQGATVALVDIDLDLAESVAADIRHAGGDATAHFVDLADRDSVNSMVETVLQRHGNIHALINNGGLDAQPGLASDIDATHWNTLIDTDLSGQWWCTQAVLPNMKARGYGRIIFMSSSSIYIGGRTISPAYLAAKAGLVGLTVGLASQLEESGILVNCLMPGPTGNTSTPMDPEDVPVYLAEHPLGFGGTQPLVDSVRYLLDSTGDWVSGAIHNVSGGRLRGR